MGTPLGVAAVEYKVISWASAATPTVIQDLLNAEATHGWRLVQVVVTGALSNVVRAVLVRYVVQVQDLTP